MLHKKKGQGAANAKAQKESTSDTTRNPAGKSSQAVEHLQHLRSGGPWFLIAFIPDNDNTATTVSTAADVDAFVRQYIGQRNIYYGVNPTRTEMRKKPAKTDISAIEYMPADLDPAMGEAPEAAKERYRVALERYPLKAAAVVDSGNGLNRLWRLAEPIDIGRYPPVWKEGKKGKGQWVLAPEAQKIVDDVEARCRQIMVDLGSVAGTQNIDRILRLPGTINLPNAAKGKAGKVKCPAKLLWINGAAYPLDAFPAPKPAPERKAKASSGTIEIGEDIAPDDPRLKKLAEKWIALGFKGEGIAERYKGDRSNAVFAFACEAFRAGIAEDVLATCLMRWTIGDHIRDSSNVDRTLRRTLDRSRAFVEDSKLFGLNEQHCVLSIAGKTRVATWGPDPDFPDRKTIVSFSGFGDFKALQDKYRHTFVVKDKKGEEVEITSGVGSWWIANPNRRQYDGGMRFMPNSDEDVVNETLNLWQGFSVAPRKPEGASGASGCQRLLDHGLRIICSGNEEHFDYMMKREALIAQKRIRSEIAIGLHTEEEGTGKETWCGAFRHLYGVHGMQVQNPEHVIGKHNAHLEVLLRLTADEALFAGDPRQRNALYNLITEPRLTIEPKFVGVYRAPNHLYIDVISNSKHYIPVSGTARRFMVPTVSPERASDHPYFHQIKVQLIDEGGYEALLHHLLYEIDIRDFNVRSVPKTAGLLDQKLSSTDPEQGWWLDMLMNGELPAGCDEPNKCPTAYLYEAYIKHVQRQGVRRRSIETQLGIFLKKVVPGLRKVEGTYETMSYRKEKRQGLVYLFPPLIECRAEFAKTFQQDIAWPDNAEWTMPAEGEEEM